MGVLTFEQTLGFASLPHPLPFPDGEGSIRLRTIPALPLAIQLPSRHNRTMTNALYYGDNLEVLSEHIGDSSVDLIYLDPPFNSNASYNVLFRAPSGANGEKGADASIEAFDDTWAWG